MARPKKRMEARHLIEELEDYEYWKEVSIELNRPLENAIRRDRYHRMIYGEEYFDDTHDRRVFDVIYIPNQDPESLVFKREISQQLCKALNELDDKDIFILTEIFLYFKTLNEVGHELGMSINAVRKRRIKALRILRKSLIKQGFNIKQK